MSTLLAVPIGVFAGLSIGVVGVGGVILVPLLAFAGVPVHAAVAASMMSYVFCGLVGSTVYGRQGSISWAAVLPLALGSAPGALAGALIAAVVPGAVLLACTAGLVLLVGARTALVVGASTALGPASSTPAPALPSRTLLCAAGAAVGCGAALTGTSGPLLLVPLLLLWRLPVLRVIGLGQAIQVPIAAAATFGNLLAGTLDPGLGLLLALGLVAGALAGARLAHRLPPRLHARLVGLVLVLAGGLLALRLRHGAATP